MPQPNWNQSARLEGVKWSHIGVHTSRGSARYGTHVHLAYSLGEGVEVVTTGGLVLSADGLRGNRPISEGEARYMALSDTMWAEITPYIDRNELSIYAGSPRKLALVLKPCHGFEINKGNWVGNNPSKVVFRVTRWMDGVVVETTLLDLKGSPVEPVAA